MLPKTVATISLVGFTVLMSLFALTTPATAGPFGLLMIFVSAYLTVLGLMSFFLFGANRAVVRVGKYFAVKKPLQKMTFKRSYYYSTVLAMAPLMLIGMQSIGSVGIYEFLLVVLFEVVACLYVSRTIPQ